MQCHSTQQIRSSRRAFTLIELLVVISIIAVLMSLILPAIQNAREAGRRTQCLNNIRNVTTAAAGYASANKSKLPALSYYPAVDSGSGPVTIYGRSWVVELLPYLDQQGIFDRWNKEQAWNAGANASLAENLYVEVLACPNDESAFQTAGGLSYVANGGFTRNGVASRNNADGSGGFLVEQHWELLGNDWDQDSTVSAADHEIDRASGVFWSEFQVVGTGGAVTKIRSASAAMGKIYDGAGNTIMFTENLNGAKPDKNWSSPDPNMIGFFYPIDSAKISNVAPIVNLQANADQLIPAGTPAFPNEARTGPDGAQPFPNSNHPGIVIVSFCDGAARTLSEGIDGSVYVKLVTPGMTRLRSGTPAEDPVSSNEF